MSLFGVEKIHSSIHSASDAFDAHTELLHTIAHPDSLDGKMRYSCAYLPDLNKAEVFARMQNIINDERQLLNIGQTIYVSADICEEISEAASTMLDSVIIEQDAFVPHGVIFLETPFIYALPEPSSGCVERWSIPAIGYCVVDGGINVFLYGNIHSVYSKSTTECLIIEKGNMRVISESADLTTNYTSLIDELENQQDYKTSLIGASTGKLRFVDVTRFDFGQSSTRYDECIYELKRFILAIFRLSYEYLEVTSERQPRNVRRRAERIGRPTDGYTVSLKLRRTKYESGDGSHASPSYAFRVRGHWKRAYLRSRGFPVGDARAYRHVYVKDYIKGRGDVVESRRVVRMER